jgi:N-lysine methyltransferase SETD6
MAPAPELAAFVAWMRVHGVWLDPRATLATDAGVAAAVGVRARTALRAGTTLCRIPKAAVLSWRNSAAAAAVDAAGLRGAVATAVALMVERARGPASRWYAYLQLLPDHEPLPILWPHGEAAALLAGTDAAALRVRDRALLRADYVSLVRPFFHAHSAALGLDASATTYACFAAAATVVASRAFNVDRHHGQALVPLADLFNHRSGAETIHVVGSESACTCCPPDDSDDSDSDDAVEEDDEGEEEDEPAQDAEEEEEEKDPVHRQRRRSRQLRSRPRGRGRHGKAVQVAADWLEMELVADVAAGDEVWNTYGPLTTAALLCKYGFAEAHNPHDTVALPASLVRVCAVAAVGPAQWRARWQFWRRFADAEDTHVLGPDGAWPDGLLALAMTVTAPATEFARWRDLAPVEAASASAILRMPSVQALLRMVLDVRTAALVPADAATVPAGRRAQYCAYVRQAEDRVLARAAATLAAAGSPAAPPASRKRPRPAPAM